MIQHPAILALLTSSFIISGMLISASWFGKQILSSWDLSSGSELQLALERRTYLISTLISYALFFQIFSLFLFIHTAEDLHVLFTGAMCAAGTLAVNSSGYPTLILKMLNCTLAGVWLIINHADIRGYDYPLIKPKYLLLNLLALLILIETVLQFSFFLRLKGDVITSCCGSLFSSDTAGFSGNIASLPHTVMQPLFFAAMAATIGCAVLFMRKRKGAYLFSITSTVTFFIAAASLLSFICLYYYELPSHHCPFCILQQEYGFTGYLLYATLLGGAVTGIGVGVLHPFTACASLKLVIPALQRKLIVATMVLYLLFFLLTADRMIFSNLRLVY